MSVKRAFFSVFQKLTLFCCAIFFGFANAFSANLPSGYTELEYIQSTGTQYIDTGVSGSVRWIGSAQASSNTTSSQVLLIGNPVGPRGTFVGSVGSKNKWTTWATDDTDYPITSAQVFDLIWTNTGVSGTIGEVRNINHDYESDQGLSRTWKICSSTYPFAGKLYYFKAYQNDIIVRDFIPAQRNSDNVIGMYDAVNDVFYQNAGTGEFTAGPVVGIRIATTAYNSARFNLVKTDLDSAVATIREIVTKTINQTAAIASLQADKQTRPEDACPAGKKCLLVETEENGVIVPHWFPIVENICGVPSGYTCLDYIQSSGTQYIDTGVVPKTFDYEITTTGSFDITAGGPNAMWGYLTSGGNMIPRWVLATYSGHWLGSANDTRSVSYADTLKHTFVNEVFLLNGTPTSRLYVDGEQVQQVAISTHPETWADNTLSIYLFGRNNNGTFGSAAALKIYRHIVKKNGTVIQDLIPAKNSSNVVGMYDTVNNVFYQNAGTGTFTAGPEM